MSKMKYLLRKLHIGGGVSDHVHHRPSTSLDPPPTTPPTSVVSPSSASPSSTAPIFDSESGHGVGPSGSSGMTESNYFEEEFQMQLALAMSVSDPDSKDDLETTQIKAVKQISLGCAPSQSLVEFLSLRYWTYNVISYDEKIMDGFYDVYGFNSNSATQGKMPLLIDLAAVSILDNYDNEVILVNREEDVGLRQLEERALLISLECSSLRKGLSRNFLLHKIANLVVDRMGGPVTNAEDISRRWASRSYELRVSMKSIVIPLGRLDVGLSRHRALLFKVLADKINLPCTLVKGSYYTGTDEGAVNMIKFDNESEFIIDLMGAPGTLIPAEVPSSQLPAVGFDVRNPSVLADNLSRVQASISGSLSLIPASERNTKNSTLAKDPFSPDFESGRNCESETGNIEHQQFLHEVGFLTPSSEQKSPAEEEASAAQKKQVNDVSEYVITAAKDPEFAQKLCAVLLESGASPPLDLFSSMGSHGFVEKRAQGNQLVRRNSDGAKSDPEFYNKEWSLVPFTGGHMLNHCDGIQRDLCGNVVSQPLQELSSAVYQSVSISQFDNTGTKHPKAEALKIGNSIVKDGELAIEEVQMLAGDRPDSSTLANDQIDKILGSVAEWEILWEDLQIADRVGIGSYGEVYRGEWNGTEVAVKKFMNQDISGNALALFKCEVEIMSRLRHPNVVLFMGAVTRPPNLSILTEFLPRGSLYKLLHKPNLQLDEKRRMRMALDVAKGMNYLHTSHPVIVHRDLKTPNLLVDKNWVVKVCDFGMSRMKHHTFLSSKSTAGTAEWTAPEVLRNEPSNEKCDVYSFGIILWELATLDVPWTGYHSMQVIGAVGFQGKRMDIPPRVDPEVAKLIRECWQTNPQARPSFGQIIARLKSFKHLEIPKEVVSQGHPHG
ncbi:hypothetical protein Leryth_018313 [Lithospermum erythrorhizon]|nr:hypothetical protein Leryth_018313 [Lithospermum erythrorhizon]